jgi:hypothetical protein
MVKIPKSENWDQALPALVGSVITLVSMLVPPRAVMRIRGFGNYLGVVANWGGVRWDFFKNGVPIYPYFAIRTQMGYAAQTRPIEPIKIEGSCLFEIRATREAGVLDPSTGVALDWDMEYPS